MWPPVPIWTAMTCDKRVNMLTEDKAEMEPNLLYVTVFARNNSSQKPFS
jgi:hypothetical protein